MLRLAFHFNNHSTLGHSITTYSLVKLFKSYYKDKIKIIVIEDGITKRNILPFSKYARLYFSPLVRQNSHDIKNRAIFIKNILNNFKPDILITEYFPFNRNFVQHYTFPHILEFLKKRFQTKIISNCTYLNWSNDTFNLVKSFYDLVLFHLPERFFYDYRNYLPQDNIEALDMILKQFHRKIFFTGFLIDKKNKLDVSNNSLIKKRLGLDGNKKLIIVSRGGRAEYEKLIIYSILLARSHRDWFFLISTGPSISNEDYRKFQNIAKGIENVKLSKIIYPDFDCYLRTADLSINMGGYNTFVRLLYFRQKSIIIPINNTEQVWNARLLNSFLPCEILFRKDIKISLLDKKMRYLLSIKKKQKKYIDDKWFNGLDNTLNIIKSIV